MKEFTVIWFYIANHGCHKIQADSREGALAELFRWYSNPEFADKARVFVTEEKPLEHEGSKHIR